MKKFGDASFKISFDLLEMLRDLAKADHRSIKSTIELILRERFPIKGEKAAP